MEITEAQFAQIEDCLPLQRGNVSLSNLRVLNAILFVATRKLLVTGAGLGALLFIAPWRRLVFRLLRPAVLSGLVLEVVKAGMRRR